MPRTRGTTNAPQDLTKAELFFLCGAPAADDARRAAERLLGVSAHDPDGLEYLVADHGLSSEDLGRLIQKLGHLEKGCTPRQPVPEEAIAKLRELLVPIGRALVIVAVMKPHLDGVDINGVDPTKIWDCLDTVEDLLDDVSGTVDEAIDEIGTANRKSEEVSHG